MKTLHLKSLSCLFFLFAWPAIAHTTAPFGERIEDFGGATLLTPRWLSVADYPREAVKGEIQGRVVVAFNINAKGRVETCEVKSSSGHKALDVVPCRLLQRKARFASPADDAGCLSRGRCRHATDNQWRA